MKLNGKRYAGSGTHSQPNDLWIGDVCGAGILDGCQELDGSPDLGSGSEVGLGWIAVGDPTVSSSAR